jgi:hypothetical protein
MIRLVYSKRFLSFFCQQMTPDEIQLVADYRGLAPRQREGVVRVIAEMVIERVKGGA